MKQYDLIILGGGASAYAAAIKASEFNAKVAMVTNALGGTCVNVGCVPSKHLLTVGEIYHYSKENNFKGIKLRQEYLNFSEIISQKDKLVEKLRKEKYIEVLDFLPNVDLYKSSATFCSENEVELNNEKEILKADKFIIATGSSPNIIKISGIDKVDYLTNVEALSLKELPESIIVIGGRALGLEFAQMFAHFFSREKKVTVLQRSDRIIPEEEPEISYALKYYLEKEGIEIQTGVAIKSVRKEGNKKIVTAEIKGNEMEFEGEQLLMATGRKPNSKGLNLKKVGVKTKKNGAIIVNEYMQTTSPNIYAAGDVIGDPMLETTAAKEGSIAAENALMGSKKKMDYSAVPHAIFTHPQVASVGLTDKKAVEMGYECNCRTLEFSLIPKAAIIMDTRGLIKMVLDNKTKRILGIHILAPYASELIHEATFAVKYKLTIHDIIDTVHIFPTLSESIKLVAQSFIKEVSKLSCCVE